MERHLAAADIGSITISTIYLLRDYSQVIVSVFSLSHFPCGLSSCWRLCLYVQYLAQIGLPSLCY